MLDPLRSLIWAAGRLSIAAETLLAIARTRPDIHFDRTLRREAVAALAMSKPGKAALDGLEELAGDADPQIRAMAAEAVVQANPARAGELAGRVLSDRVALDRVASHDGANLRETLRTASSQVHYQGVTVPHLAALGDVAGLKAVVANTALSEETRQGAVEGLAAMASETAESELEQIGRASANPEEVRKAAWRGLRRSRRARQRRAQKEVVK
jgi:ParB family chromosome partitioning protein